jgi:hypothetical protein
MHLLAETSQPTSNPCHALSLTTAGVLYVHLQGNQGLQIVAPPKDAFLPAKGTEIPHLIYATYIGVGRGGGGGGGRGRGGIKGSDLP